MNIVFFSSISIYHSYLLNASVYEEARKKNGGGGGDIEEGWKKHLKAFFKKSWEKTL